MQRAAWVVAFLLASVPAFGSADLEIDPFSFGFLSYAKPNELLHLQLYVTNHGPDAAVNAEARVDLPPGTTIGLILPTIGGFLCEAEGDSVVCTASSLPVGTSITLIDVTLPASTADSIVVFHASVDADNEDGEYANEWNSAVGVYRVHTVTSTADSGAGTLRAEIEDANATCHEFCEIDFNLPERAVIEPLTPLPTYSSCASLRIAGLTDPLNSSVARPVEISGAKVTSGSGITIHADCDTTRFVQHSIQGLAINRFPVAGIEVSGLRTSAQITSCFLGTDATGKIARPNMRGVLVDVDTAFVGVAGSLISRNTRDGIEVANGLVTLSQNIIRANRGNGVFLRSGTSALALENIITRNGQSGYALAPGAALAPYYSDSISANGVLAIDQGNDGPTPAGAGFPTAPVIISAFYDRNANVTHVRGTVETEALPFQNLVIRVFSDSGYNASGHAEAEHDETRLTPVVIETPTEGTHNWSVTLDGDLRGRVVTALAGVTDSVFVRNVSELSEGVPVR